MVEHCDWMEYVILLVFFGFAGICFVRWIVCGGCHCWMSPGDMIVGQNHSSFNANPVVFIHNTF